MNKFNRAIFPSLLAACLIAIPSGNAQNKAVGGKSQAAKVSSPNTKSPAATKDKTEQQAKPVAKLANIEYQTKFVNGMQQVKQHFLEYAERQFNQGIAIDPAAPQCYFGLASIRYKMGRFPEALKYANMALTRDPKYVDCIYLRGKIFEAQEEYEKAIQDFSTLIKQQPSLTGCYLSRGLVYLSWGQIQKARAELETVSKISPNDSSVVFLRANLEYYDCQYERVISDCTTALYAGLGIEELYFLRSKAYTRIFDFQSARSDIKLAESVGRYDYSAELREVDDFEYDHVNREKDPAKRWALACSSPNAEFNTEGFESLSGVVLNKNTIEREKRSLEKWWGINNRFALISMIKDHEHDGHNSTWMEMWQASKREKATSKKISSFTSDRRRAIVQKYGDQFGQRGILAWDLARNICLCRWGYRVGFLNKDEAFNLIMPQAIRIQKSYSSWKQFVTEYYIARRFWNEEMYMEDLERNERTVHRLISDPNGLSKIPWNTPLGAPR